MSENEEDDTVRGPTGSGNFVRNLTEDALFTKEIRNCQWIGYNCFDELEGTELLWLTVHCADCTEPDFVDVDDIVKQLEAWRKLDHPLLLRITAMWVTRDRQRETINIVTDMCGRTSLRTYRQLHSRLGFPAIQKLSRQLFKVLLYISDYTQLPVSKVIAVDVQVHPVNAKICLLPTFIWRDPANYVKLPFSPTNSSGTLSKSSSRRAMLHTFVVLMIEMLTGNALHDAPDATLRQQLTDAELPSQEVRDSLMDCLPLEGVSLPSAGQLLDSTLLDARKYYNLSMAEPRSPVLSDRKTDDSNSLALMSQSLDRRFSTIGMNTLERAIAARRATNDGAVAPTPAVAIAAIEEIDSDAGFKLGCVKGLDYLISVKGGKVDKSIEFTVKLEHQNVSNGAEAPAAHLVRFPFDLNADTVEQVVEEMAPLFSMEETDRELTAAAMKEVIASLVPEMEHLYSGISRMSFGSPLPTNSLNRSSVNSLDRSIANGEATPRSPLHDIDDVSVGSEDLSPVFAMEETGVASKTGSATQSTRPPNDASSPF